MRYLLWHAFPEMGWLLNIGMFLRLLSFALKFESASQLGAGLSFSEQPVRLTTPRTGFVVSDPHLLYPIVYMSGNIGKYSVLGNGMIFFLRKIAAVNIGSVMRFVKI